MIHDQQFKTEGGFPLSRNFSVRTRVKKIEAMYERPRIHVKVEPRSTLTFTRGLSYIASILFTCVKFTSVRTENYASVEINPN